MARADDQISLPIAVASSRVNDGGALIDQDLMGDGAAPLAHPAPLAPLLVDAQRQVQRAADALVLIDALIDALVRDAWQALDALMTGNLLRTPGFGQLLTRKLPCGGGYAASVGGALLAARRGQKARHLRLICVEDPVAVQLAADAGRMPAQLAGDGSERPTGIAKRRDLVSFFLDEMAVAHAWQTLLGGRASRMLPHPIHLPPGLPLHFVVESALQVQDGRLGIGFASSTLRFPLFAVESFSVFLFLACFCNLVLLFVGRARREAYSAAIRFAFGARIANEVHFAVVEVSILAAAGCALSIPIAWSAAHFISRAIQSMPGFDTMETIHPSTSLTLEATAVLFLTAWLAVAAISVWNSQKTGGPMLRTGSRPATMRTNAWIIGFEVFASILLISASFTGFLGFQHLVHQPSGFSSEGTVLASLDMEASSTGTDNNSGLVTSKETRILDSITHSPGVRSVATINVAPLTGGLARDTIAVRGEDGSLRQQTVWPAEVSDQYFSAIGTSILRGRGFTHDDTEGEKICVVSRRAASSLFGSRNPLGEYLYHIATGAEKQPAVVYCRVVGVADNAHFTSISDPADDVVYRLSRQEWPNLVVRAETSGLAMGAIRSAAEVVDPAALYGDMSTIQQNIDDDLRLRKVITQSGILSAGVAAFILGIGFFGILSIQVVQRKREIGIQIAIGASQVQICLSLMKKFRRAVVIGLATGSGLALIASENLAKVYGLESRYAIWGYIGSLVFLGVLLTVAAFVPLMRALAVSPMECLSSE